MEPLPGNTQPTPPSQPITQISSPTVSVPPNSTQPVTMPLIKTNTFVRNMVIVVIAVIVILVSSVAYLILRSKSTPAGGGISTSLFKEDLSRYDVDADSDGYPDFIEKEVGLDPNTSEYNTCKKGDCGDLSLQQTNTKHNVLIILDSSGSMGIGNPTKMDIAKQAIKNYIEKASSNSNIGLMVYGNKGSNSESDKAISCAGAEVISPLGQFTNSSVDNVLSLIKPVGWTPIGLAIQQGSQAFAGKNGENNEMIILTDGEETCNTSPVQKASEAKSSSLNIKINIIGFAVNANEQTQLNQISTNGGGSFATANNLTELDQKFGDLYENGLKLLQNLKCNTGNADVFRACYNSAFQKVTDWIQQHKLLLYQKKISKDEYNRLDSLGTKLYDQQKNITTTETQNAINQYKQNN